jgi:hypothetical protein
VDRIRHRWLRVESSPAFSEQAARFRRMASVRTADADALNPTRNLYRKTVAYALPS